MPELPEVEIVMRGLRPVLEGGVVEALRLYRPDLRFLIPADLPARLAGRRISRVERRGKYIVAHREGGDGFILHLGMSGRVKIIEAGRDYARETHDHFEILLRGGARVIYNDPRRFGFLDSFEGRTASASRHFEGMGPEPLDSGFDGEALHAALAGRKVSIKQALLDQKIIAGVGNIYACEALFRAGVSPLRAAGAVSRPECLRLAGAIRAVLNEAIEAGGSTLKDYRHTDDGLGYFQHRFSVYDREGEGCPGCECDRIRTGGVARIAQGGRSTFYCKRKQR
jgi:formamidopyrimidine-DNA glycosylase